MMRMRAIGVIFVVAACASPAPGPRPAPAGAIDASIARVERGLLPAVRVRGEDRRFALDERMQKYRVPGLSIAVFEHHRLRWAKGYGVTDAAAPAPVTTETLFQAGSISKSVNALGVLLAVADGTLALDAPINDALVSWKLPENELTRATPVTLRQLLSHTAGTTVHGFPGYAAGEAVPTTVQVLDGAPPANTPAVRVDLAPGSQFRYSGGGTTITQLALADRIKRPYPTILAERVLAPLGMTHSTYENPLPDARLPAAAAGHDAAGAVIAGKRHTYPEMAAAGLWTTPSDLARFFAEISLARSGRSKVVAREVALQMTTAVAPAGPDHVGLGVFLHDRHGVKLFGHDGADAGFQALAIASLDGGFGVVMMASSENSFRLFAEIERAVFAEYGWGGLAEPLVRVAVEPARLARMAGRYGGAAPRPSAPTGVQRPFTIVPTGGRLELHRPFRDPVELVPIAPDHVVDLDGGAHFVVAAGGELVIEEPAGPMWTATRLADDLRVPRLELAAGRDDAALAAYRELRRVDPDNPEVQEPFLNQYGYQLMLEGNAAGAVKVLRLNTLLYPDSANTYDSLGEAYLLAGDRPHAIAAYEACLASLERDRTTPPPVKDLLRKNALAKLATLRN